MIRPIVLAALTAVAPAAAQTPAGAVEALRACIDEAERDPEAERACAGRAALACVDADAAAQTTVGMVGCYAAEIAAWDAVLNTTYGDLVTLSAALAAAEIEAGGAAVDQEGLLRDAQRAWIAFRDADCAQEAGFWGAGSMRQVAGAQCMLDRTATRTLELIEKRRVFENP